MRRLAPAALLLALAACKSTAPNTMAAAGVYSALALGATVAEQKKGWCDTPCRDGLVCNPRTGWCEAPSQEVICHDTPEGRRCELATMPVVTQGATPPASSPVGVGLLTPGPPPPPAESSPGKP